MRLPAECAGALFVGVAYRNTLYTRAAAAEMDEATAFSKRLASMAPAAPIPTICVRGARSPLLFLKGNVDAPTDYLQERHAHRSESPRLCIHRTNSRRGGAVTTFFVTPHG
jgi:hypothetical protein